MKIIFLDHDGVICLGSEFGSRFKKQNRSVGQTIADGSIPVIERFDNFNNKAIKVLNEILEETGAEIVVSSDWKKWANLEELGEFYELQGITKKPIALTPNIKDFSPSTADLFHWKNWFDRIRIIEIKEYLKNNEIDSWVAVDDMDMSLTAFEDNGLSNFVHTPRLYEGIKQSGVKEKIISFLNK